MGKLHSLRRAIERDPKSWLYDYDGKAQQYRLRSVNRSGKRPWVDVYNYKERRWEKKYVGSYTFFPCEKDYYWTTRYKSFLKKVLTGLGYRVR